jgi:hypothetical protein
VASSKRQVSLSLSQPGSFGTQYDPHLSLSLSEYNKTIDTRFSTFFFFYFISIFFCFPYDVSLSSKPFSEPLVGPSITRAPFNFIIKSFSLVFIYWRSWAVIDSVSVSPPSSYYDNFALL